MSGGPNNNTMGRLLKEGRKLSIYQTLREVENISGISNAYLSQLESVKIKRPSAVVLYTLSKLYNINFDDLMVASGIIDPKVFIDIQPIKHSLNNLSLDEYEEISKYLGYLRYKSK